MLDMAATKRSHRQARVLLQAERTFGDPEIALRWFSRPKRRFENRTPMEMLRSEAGAKRVEEMLGQIEYGIFA